MDSNDVCMTKNKQTTFDKNGVHVRCCWKPTDNLKVQSIRACMFSIRNQCFTHYYDSNVNRTPVAVDAVSSVAKNISTDSHVVDMYYVGDVTARHWAGDRGGNSANYSTIVIDYGARLKSYFNCYDNYNATVCGLA